MLSVSAAPPAADIGSRGREVIQVRPLTVTKPRFPDFCRHVQESGWFLAPSRRRGGDHAKLWESLSRSRECAVPRGARASKWSLGTSFGPPITAHLTPDLLLDIAAYMSL